ncbi:MAG TPA: 7TM diverse intracellular signaling domain-containing protein [Spirochaetota bacterium]|nr:7TM diverse intracellular signaling domain-containing protein [Spirochaetota bacterium]HPI89820.1 7TM diverse intracellular signaling domain-containing protein [Spirochaetota bacterium]HPR49390.1 7TM diverse intracellular signaling domain-containing protein [Spirochaetota bacterium]
MQGKRYIVSLIFFIFFIPPALAAEKVVITDDLQSFRFGKSMRYLKETGDRLSLDDVRSGKFKWEESKTDSFNFGFNAPPYWFSFTIDNRQASGEGWYFEIDYPMIDYIELYTPAGDGSYKLIKTGDRYSFSQRDIIDRNFIFFLNPGGGEHTYYIRFQTESSLNFTPLVWSIKDYVKRMNVQFPVFWMYFGLMLIMALYNLIIFFSVREKTYIFYSLFIVTFILFQSTLNGFAFQYLWPDSVWWANNCLPFFMLNSAATAGLFISLYIETKRRRPVAHKVYLFGILLPMFLLSLVAFTGNYSLSIRLSTAGTGIGAILICIVGGGFYLRNSREARVAFIAFSFLVVGVLLYVMKSFGILPSNFVTNWSVQIGSSMVILVFSFGLADKINFMKKDLQKFNTELEQKEREARKRNEFLENTVSIITGMSGDLFEISRELSTIGNNFGTLSTEQAATSEEMSAAFEELTSSNERIYDATVVQKEEGQKTREYSTVLMDSQKNVARVSGKVVQGISVITASAKETGVDLAKMIERMEYIDRGGKAIDGIMVMIDDITDRINLLSLNAAIEAARAGDHGRGFAVVADEIGKLASATSDNSKEISTQIKSMINDITAGMAIVDKTRNSLEVIFKSIDDINSLIDDTKNVLVSQGNAISEVVKQADLMENMSRDIADATREQNTSMEENIKTVSRLSEIAQEIATANQKILEFTGSIVEKSKKLQEIIGSSS